MEKSRYTLRPTAIWLLAYKTTLQWLPYAHWS
nr:MAG TPA: hypothetical protein [Caudoviricetes sp.]